MLLCQMDQWSTKLKGCIKHDEPQHKKHMENDKSRQKALMISNDVIHVQAKEGGKTVMSKASTP